MNDQEQPEDGTNPTHVEAHAPVAEMHHPSLTVAPIDDELEEEVDDEDFAEEEEALDDEEVDVRSMVEQLFDEDDLGEVMSELDVLTLEDAAAYLKVEYGQIRRMLREQGLPGRKIGEEWRFLRGALADWLRAPGGNAAPATPAPAPERAERPAQPERREFTQKPPLRERFSQGPAEGQQQRYPQQGGSRYPQQGASRYPQENRPPRRPQNEGGYQGGAGQGGGYQAGGYQQGAQGQGNQGQGGYPPPRRPRYGNDQEQQAPQGEYRPPRRPYAGGQGGNQAGNFSGGQGAGSAGGQKYNGGPKKPKRKALNEQRFNRLDRRRFEGEPGQDGPPDAVE